MIYCYWQKQRLFFVSKQFPQPHSSAYQIYTAILNMFVMPQSLYSGMLVSLRWIRKGYEINVCYYFRSHVHFVRLKGFAAVTFKLLFCKI
jgi:hypothetical protein